MAFNKADIAIVIPSFNEGERLRAIVEKIKASGYDNIIVVDDGSTDNSIELIKNFNLVILKHIINRGAGAATETGLMYCRKYLNPKAVVMIDADTQHDVDDIDVLLTQHYKTNADITIGNRFMHGAKNMPVKNIVFNKLANIVTSVFAWRKIRDSQSGFKVFNRKALFGLILQHDKYEHCSEIFIKASELNLKVIDVPIKVYYPEEIKDKGQHFMNGVRTFSNLLYSMLFKSH